MSAIAPILLTGDGTNCVAATSVKFTAGNYRIDQMLSAAAKEFAEKIAPPVITKEPEKKYESPDNAIYTIVNGAAVTGMVVDKEGKNPVPGVTIKVKGYNKATATDAAGNFILNNLKPGRYILIFFQRRLPGHRSLRYLRR